MMTEIRRELTAIKKTNEITSKEVLAWVRRVEAQTAQKALIETTKEIEEFNAMRRHELNNSDIDKGKVGQRATCNNCKFCGKAHVPCRCPAYCKSCLRCGQMNHFECMQKSEQEGAKRCRAVHDTCQDRGQRGGNTEEFEWQDQ